MSRRRVVLDGNEAAALVAYKASEVVAIYPITPSSTMGEWADAWSAAGERNLWGQVPVVQEMQSEGGAAGAIHGALQGGSMACTFTASQGLLLMIPNMYKIAGELTPTVFHVAARALAAQALSIFGDHSDVMAARSTGFALLCSGSVQEAMDLALVAHAATLESRVPFLHFFDGFRTSHELAQVDPLGEREIRALIDERRVREHRARGLTPDRPVLRGTAQNPDVYFQAREAANPFYLACPDAVQAAMDRLAALTGRPYRLFDYHGAPDAERVIVMMGSGAEAAHEAVDRLVAAGEKVGVLKVRLYRPFDAKRFTEALPRSVRVVAALDRTKEPGSLGEPLFLDVVTALAEDAAARAAAPPRVVGGRYGLSSKEFTPAMVKAVFDELRRPAPKPRFTAGITDDVTGLSLAPDPSFVIEPAGETRALFYGLGSDGTVSANKNTIKIIGETTDLYAQGYFVYDSKKAGTMTVSHLRFGPTPIRSSYLVERAQFVGCHQFGFLKKYDFLEHLQPGGVFLLNSPHPAEETWDHLPLHVQRHLAARRPRFYVIDAYRAAREAGLGGTINTIMQTCFFAVTGLLPRERALEVIKEHIRKEYGRKGEEVVALNFRAVDGALSFLREVPVPAAPTAREETPPPVSADAPAFVRDVLGPLIAGRGDDLPVSAFPPDGTYPVGTARWEKRNIAHDIPVWDEALCIQCGKCVLVCPHAVIRAKVLEPALQAGAPEGFKAVPARNRDWAGRLYTLQVSPENCTSCAVCVDVCPAKDKADPRRKALEMRPQAPLRDAAHRGWEFFLGLPEADRAGLKRAEVRSVALLQPLFEFSGACAACGETPYLKLLSQLFGDRAVIANATGCSSIYGGNLPTTPWCANKDGRGPAWNNSLFEDNAEFGLGIRLSLDQRRDAALALLRALEGRLPDGLAREIAEAPQEEEAHYAAQRDRVRRLKRALAGIDAPEARDLLDEADALVRRSLWIVGGDGWAYDIGYGGLDHVLASGRDVNILVLDTEVYSNTGGQMSKSTPRGAVAKFAVGGKPLGKKDLALMAMSYRHAYVAQVAVGARDEHTVRTFLEAEAHRGPSLIIAYSHCISHGIPMATALREQQAAVASGHWMLFRYNPALAAAGRNPLQLDSPAPDRPLREFLYKQNRFKMLAKSRPEDARRLLDLAQKDVLTRRRLYEHLAAQPAEAPAEPEKAAVPGVG
jgi:pyruvate-ferredoxin/flavodoxin oxidoreductase